MFEDEFGIPLSTRLQWFMRDLDRDQILAFSILIFLVIILPVWLTTRWFLRRRAMVCLARELGCRFTKRGETVVTSTWWGEQKRKYNIIEGTWRGQPILIYDVREWDGGESVDWHTVINGEKYFSLNLWWIHIGRLPVRKIRRVLANDPTIRPVKE